MGFETARRFGHSGWQLHVVADGVNANGQRNTQGRVTSTYYSPDAQARHRNGPFETRAWPDWRGGGIQHGYAGGTVKARVRDTVFYDKDGEKQNV